MPVFRFHWSDVRANANKLCEKLTPKELTLSSSSSSGYSDFPISRDVSDPEENHSLDSSGPHVRTAGRNSPHVPSPVNNGLRKTVCLGSPNRQPSNAESDILLSESSFHKEEALLQIGVDCNRSGAGPLRDLMRQFAVGNQSEDEGVHLEVQESLYSEDSSLDVPTHRRWKRRDSIRSRVRNILAKHKPDTDDNVLTASSVDESKVGMKSSYSPDDFDEWGGTGVRSRLKSSRRSPWNERGGGDSDRRSYRSSGDTFVSCDWPSFGEESLDLEWDCGEDVSGLSHSQVLKTEGQQQTAKGTTEIDTAPQILAWVPQKWIYGSEGLILLSDEVGKEGGNLKTDAESDKLFDSKESAKDAERNSKCMILVNDLEVGSEETLKNNDESKGVEGGDEFSESVGVKPLDYDWLGRRESSYSLSIISEGTEPGSISPDTDPPSRGSTSALVEDGFDLPFDLNEKR